MKNNAILKQAVLASFVAIVASVLWFASNKEESVSQQHTNSYIVKANERSELSSFIETLSLKPTHDLKVINAVAVDLTQAQYEQLKLNKALTITPNYQVELAGIKGWARRNWKPLAQIPNYVDADYAHAIGNFGDDVTIGFLDTGIDSIEGSSFGYGLSTDLYGRDKFWGTYDAITNTISNYSNEENGHL